MASLAALSDVKRLLIVRLTTADGEPVLVVGVPGTVELGVGETEQANIEIARITSTSKNSFFTFNPSFYSVFLQRFNLGLFT